MPKKKILVIDDETSITRLLKFILEKSDTYTVDCENLGVNALKKIKDVRPDLLILDVNLPDLSGGEIASLIQQDPSLEKLPIIFLTGDITSDEAEGGLKIGGHPALAKPIDVDKLLSCIEKSLK